MRPTVLVLLASYNGSPWITEQIDSILSQSNVNVSLIIGDDGSTDATHRKLAEYSVDDRVRVQAGNPPSGAAAQNFFQLVRYAAIADNEYVAFSDQDDIWDAQKLSKACASLESSNAVGYSCATEAFWPDGSTRYLFQNKSFTASDYLLESAGQGCTYVLKRAAYVRIRNFLLENPELTRGIHFHDWATYALCRTWGFAWIFDDSNLLRYRQHVANDTGARANARGIFKRLILIKNGWYLRQLRSISKLCVCANPADQRLLKWTQLINSPKSVTRALKLMLFLMRGGRRRARDQAVLLASVLFGWI